MDSLPQAYWDRDGQLGVREGDGSVMANKAMQAAGRLGRLPLIARVEAVEKPHFRENQPSDLVR